MEKLEMCHGYNQVNSPSLQEAMNKRDAKKRGPKVKSLKVRM